MLLKLYQEQQNYLKAFLMHIDGRYVTPQETAELRAQFTEYKTTNDFSSDYEWMTVRKLESENAFFHVIPVEFTGNKKYKLCSNFYNGNAVFNIIRLTLEERDFLINYIKRFQSNVRIQFLFD
jgi:hypothetical protein